MLLEEAEDLEAVAGPNLPYELVVPDLKRRRKIQNSPQLSVSSWIERSILKIQGVTTVNGYVAC